MANNGSQKRKPDFRMSIEDAKALATVLAMEAVAILGRRAARFLGVVVLFAVVVGALLALLEWYIAPSGAEQRQALVVTLAQILGGAALLSGLYFTWRTLQVNREGQITERFTRAIDQLGATDDNGGPRLEIRLGGIYSLERIDKESPHRAYHGTVMEVLTAYVRENAPWPPKPPEPPKSPDDKSVPDSASTAAAEQNAESLPRSRRTDIRAILDVLKRRQEDQVPEKHRVTLDFREANLQRAYLKEFDLRGALLFETHFEGANLERANLQRAHLERAHLENPFARVYTNLKEAHLEGAYLNGANLKSARLQGAHLQGAHLQGANLNGANLNGANLNGANLNGADLSEVRNLTKEQLKQTSSGDEDTTLPRGRTPPRTGT